MEQVIYPSAEIRCAGNLFAIENFRVCLEEKEQSNPYNTTFSIRVVSESFSGYAFCEYDMKEFIRFVSEMQELFRFKQKKTKLNDICYGSKVVFALMKPVILIYRGKYSVVLQSIAWNFDLQQIRLA